MNMIFCNRLRELRSQRNLSQEQVAKLIGIGKTAISQYENGSREPSFETLVKLASIYHVTTDYLLGCDRADIVDVSGLTDRMKWLLSEIAAEFKKE